MGNEGQKQFRCFRGEILKKNPAVAKKKRGKGGVGEKQIAQYHVLSGEEGEGILGSDLLRGGEAEEGGGEWDGGGRLGRFVGSKKKGLLSGKNVG